ncbi:PREDICTED: uncharacterized protein LOC106808510 [Priapulus caudatus]|uniref:Uncharacterized protein LOC106808510 n=1 Tax=Priapulus caudatus TaxID=37621 RepID=A0ABM1E3H9_PRICU|nr:PREDICTED: uncharacterized protein LOC106808510 [Priapulus caudatus]
METHVSEPYELSEWELSKENVQPLKQGRKANRLSVALQPHGGEPQIHRLVRDEKQEFEVAIRTYSGDDPLDVWDRYIKWTEQNFPKGVKESNLVLLLQQCLSSFVEEEKYRNDRRYIEAWIKFADLSPDPLEVYGYLNDQNIGCQVAELYTSWAYVLEQLDDFPKASRIIEEGLVRGAQPTDHLLQFQRNFEFRVARHVAQGLESADPAPSGAEGGQRTSLASLKGHGKKAIVGSHRSGTGHRQGLGNMAAPKPRQTGSSFHVFCDENSAPSAVPAQTGEWHHIGTRAEVRKENEQRPGTWTKAKLHNPSGVVPKHRIHEETKPAFSIHQDDETEQPLPTPSKSGECFSKVLSARKLDKPVHPVQNIIRAQEINPHERVMYCKHKIYAGLDEFSFEELRANRYKRMQQMREQIEQEMKEKVEREMKEKIIQEMKEKMEQEMKEKIEREMKEKMEQEMKEKMEREMKEKMEQEMKEKMEREMKENMEREMKEKIQQDMKGQMHQEMERQKKQLEEQLNCESSEASSDVVMHEEKPNSRAPVLVYEQTGNVKDVSHPMMATAESARNPGQLMAEKSKDDNELRTSSEVVEPTPTMAAASVIGCLQNSQQPTPTSSASSSFIRNISRGSNNHSLSRTPSGFKGRSFLTAPSPTVNTREALGVVRGMFNTSLGKDYSMDDLDMSTKADDDQQWEAQFMKKDTTGEANQLQQALVLPGSAPFTIFNDDQNGNDDQENRPPSDYKQQKSTRPLAGILQPSLNISFLPIEEQEEEDVEMEGVEALPADDDGNIDQTFDPKFSSTKRFSIHPDQLAISGLTLSHTVASEPAEDEYMPPPRAPLAQEQQVRPDHRPAMRISVENKSARDSTCSSYAESMVHQGPTDLSPIIETSMENAKSSSSSSGCSDVGYGGFSRLRHLARGSTIDYHHSYSHQSAATPGSNAQPQARTDSHPNTTTTPYCDAPQQANYSHQNTTTTPYGIAWKQVHPSSSCTVAGSKSSAAISYPTRQSRIPRKVEAHDSGAATCQQPMADDADTARPTCPVVAGASDSTSSSEKQCSPRNSPSATAITSVDVDPFSPEVIERLLAGLMKPVSSYENYLIVDKPMCSVKAHTVLDMGTEYHIIQCLGVGAYAKIYEAEIQNEDTSKVILKTDVFGVLGTIHCMMFGEYMKTYLESGRWKCTGNFQREWSPYWKKLFDKLLNIPSCEQIPSLDEIRMDLTKMFVDPRMMLSFNRAVKQANLMMLEHA